MKNDVSWPAYLIERAIAPAPSDCHVVARSTPVVAFGNPVGARVATLGINPSCNEFINRKGELLVGQKLRLTTRESLDLDEHSPLADDHGRAILDGCASYFGVNMYAWFKPLNRILTESIGAAYGESACHLDLVQWATKPVWRNLNATSQQTLLKDGVRFLARQIETERYPLVVVNGRTALRAVEEHGIVRWGPVRFTLREPTTQLFVAEHGAQRFLGWSCNLQSQPGARRHIEALVDFVRREAGFSLLANAPDSEKAF